MFGYENFHYVCVFKKQKTNKAEYYSSKHCCFVNK